MQHEVFPLLARHAILNVLQLGERGKRRGEHFVSAWLDVYRAFLPKSAQASWQTRFQAGGAHELWRYHRISGKPHSGGLTI